MRGFQERSAEWPSAILIGAQVTEFKKTCLLWGVKTHGAAFNPIEPGETAGLAKAKTSVCQPFGLALKNLPAPHKPYQSFFQKSIKPENDGHENKQIQRRANVRHPHIMLDHAVAAQFRANDFAASTASTGFSHGINVSRCNVFTSFCCFNT
jgi:hypothetical protein